MGDESETLFASLDPAPLGAPHRRGLDRFTGNMKFMTERLRHEPDFWTEGGWLVECVGMNGSWLRGVKPNKLDALTWWQSASPVALFVWNRRNRVWCLLDLDDVKRLAEAAEVLTFENDGNEYFNIPWREVREVAAFEGDVE
jgi:hypothetical protein